MRSPTLAIIATLAITGTAGAQGTVSLSARPDSKLWIEGTSSLHDWSCKATSIEAGLQLSADYASSDVFAKSLQKVSVKVPVANLKCGHGGMDKNMYKALKADDAPAIHYILASFQVIPGSTKDDVTVKTVGTLTIAGQEKSIDMSVAAHRAADGTIRASGSLPILMTDYGVKPPTAMLGAVKTGNQVTVKFELFVAPQGAVAAAQP